ncbi:DUF1707 domain-containing protein [Modestobacter sp. L9-4]|uniref:DUF1707 SHOCT-like domain-containing protein n=1 Tax=Modestobacter sp. L9-4 TaxID=2851567 RepID=UPI001C74626B|nr:DUF1707 domain-containing protein [Modestobacter sp. L9-4]QXG74357.1 DUF1707 domain-containing protein [Modestobacter sp. L9-4]
MPEPHLRAADADRAGVADRLGAAMSAGRLTVAEYDERLTRVYAARTYGELAELTTDLPQTPQTPAPSPVQLTKPAAEPADSSCAAWGHPGASLRAAWGSWLATAVLVVGIWLATSLGAGELLYPWPVWVIGPWGAVLLAQSVGGRDGRTRDRSRRLPG